jgi:hypothetical protein
MCRKTGFVDGGVIPEKYPLDYFKRFPIKSTFVNAVVNKLKDDDIYQFLASYPSPEH